MHPEVQATVQYSYPQVVEALKDHLDGDQMDGVLDRLAQLFPDGVPGRYTMGDIYSGLHHALISGRTRDEIMANIRHAAVSVRHPNMFDEEPPPETESLTFTDDGRLDIRDVVNALLGSGLNPPSANEIINNAINHQRERLRWTCLTVADIKIYDMGKEVKLELNPGGAQRRGRLTDFHVQTCTCDDPIKQAEHPERYFFVIDGKLIQVAMSDVIYVDHNSKEKRDTLDWGTPPYS